MSDFIFNPWKGNLYDKPSNYFNCRLAVIGESFYVTEEDANNSLVFTENIIKSVIATRCKEWKCKTRFYFGVYFALTGRTHNQASPDDWSSFWHSIAYHVYIQHTGLRNSRQVPTKEMWESGAQRFQIFLKEYKPDCMIVFGKRMWPWIKDITQASSTDGQIYTISNNGHIIWATQIYHPSAFRQWKKERAHEQIASFLKIYRDASSSVKIR